jgi:putative membrane-bound dehydrogenase-like protein
MNRLRFLIAGLALFTLLPWVQAQKEHGFDNRKPSGQPYFTPDETIKRMKVAEEFEVKLFAGEPDCVNPVAFSIDEKGRVWVLECFEYPSKTPKGKAPRDRIVILEDTDGDGKCDKRTIFAEGKDFPIPAERAKAGLPAFDLATGMELGHGGVYVGAPPYLWFIENKDDKPGKFETLLGGFGSQDTHETLNTFQWGPDGRLYGMQGVFTQSTVKPLDGAETRMNAAVWAFHPKTKKFEIYAEGTSNPWGMDWRNTDGQFILACCVIPHLYHIVPGGIYRRQAGSSYNPYAYGFIKEISDHTFHKESGWAHAGLISLDVPHMPERFRNSVIFGSIHGCSLKQNILKPNGSSYIASRSDDFLVSGDKNVRPINLKWGPNGDIYMIDWHDQNPCHQAAAKDWDYERGRVYRIQLKDRKGGKADDLGKKTMDELVKLTTDPMPYTSRTAFRLLAEKLTEMGSDLASKFTSKMTADEATRENALRLRILTTDDLRIGERDIEAFIEKGSQKIQCLVSRTVGYCELSTDETVEILDALKQIALKTKSEHIRRELAVAAVRKAGSAEFVPILHALMSRTEDANDPLIPHLTWLAYEKVLSKKTGANNLAEKELAWLAEQAPTNLFVRDHIVPKAMRRMVATGQPADLALCLKFLKDCRDVNSREKALDGLAIALEGQKLTAPESWAELQVEMQKEPRLAKLTGKLAVSFRDPVAVKKAIMLAQDDKKPLAERIDALRQITATGLPMDADLLALVNGSSELPLRVEAARSLVTSESPMLVKTVTKNWSGYPQGIKAEFINVFASRKSWAKDLLQAMEAKTIDRMLVTDNTILRIQGYNDTALNTLIERAWGRSRATPADLLKTIDEMRIDLNTGTSSFARGKAVFENQCMKCHKFEGRGQDVGPLLDGAARDMEYLLANIIDPNRVIGAPYFLRIVNTLDGRVEQGVLAEEDDKFLTLKVENGVLKKIAKADMDGPVKVVEKSMMPEGLTTNMTKQDFRDLVRYVMNSPYIPQVSVNGKVMPVPTGGRISWDVAGDVKLEAVVESRTASSTQLLLGVQGDYRVLLNGEVVSFGKANKFEPDGVSVPVKLPAGKSTITIELKSTAKSATLRLMDPERVLSFPE